MRTDAQVAAWHELDPWRKSLLMAERPDWVESDEVFRLELLADLEREFGPMVHAVPRPDHDWEAWRMPDASEFGDAEYDASLDEIGEALGGLSRERVRQIATRGIEMMRKLLSHEESWEWLT